MNLSQKILELKQDIILLTTQFDDSQEVSDAYQRINSLLQIDSINFSHIASLRSVFLANSSTLASASMLALMCLNLSKILSISADVVSAEIMSQGIVNVSNLQESVIALTNRRNLGSAQVNFEEMHTNAPPRYIPPSEFTHAPEIITEFLPSGLERSVYSAFINAIDRDPGDIIDITIPNLPSWLTIHKVRSGMIEITGILQNPGVHSLLIVATNPNGQFSQVALDLTVINVNDPPYFTSIPIAYAVEGEPYVYNVTTSDPDPGDTRIVTCINKPLWADYLNTGNGTGTLAGIPPYTGIRTEYVKFKVTDAGGLEGFQDFTISIDNVLIPNIRISDDDVTYELCNDLITLTAKLEGFGIDGEFNDHTYYWEQIDSSLERPALINRTTLSLFYIGSSDHVFRFWVDKGTSKQQYRDYVVSKTPTSKTSLTQNVFTTIDNQEIFAWPLTKPDPNFALKQGQAFNPGIEWSISLDEASATVSSFIVQKLVNNVWQNYSTALAPITTMYQVADFGIYRIEATLITKKIGIQDRNYKVVSNLITISSTLSHDAVGFSTVKFAEQTYIDFMASSNYATISRSIVILAGNVSQVNLPESALIDEMSANSYATISRSILLLPGAYSATNLPESTYIADTMINNYSIINLGGVVIGGT